MELNGSCREVRTIRPITEVADIFRAYGEEFRQKYVLSPEQKRAMNAIVACRTLVLGGHESVCLDCGHRELSYNSCRNRHCPKCQSLAQAKWIAERKERILPVSHYHVVFTLPDALRRLVQQNQVALYSLLMQAASETLLEFGQDPKWIGGTVGITTVLHTWTRDLRYHPHVHSIVTAGGLSPGGQWLSPTHPEFLFPVRALGEVFRGKFLDRLERAEAKLDLKGINDLKDLLRRAAKKRWVVYAKRPFRGVEHVFEYLGRYTHRTGISNQRLMSNDTTGVRFATKNGNTAVLTHGEFIRRFLLHVLPKGFTKIRHYGLYAPQNVKTLLTQAREVLGNQVADSRTQPPTACNWQDRMKALTGIDPRVCIKCGGQIIRIFRSAIDLKHYQSTGPPAQMTRRVV